MFGWGTSVTNKEQKMIVNKTYKPVLSLIVVDLFEV